MMIVWKLARTQALATSDAVNHHEYIIKRKRKKSTYQVIPNFNQTVLFRNIFAAPLVSSTIHILVQCKGILILTFVFSSYPGNCSRGLSLLRLLRVQFVCLIFYSYRGSKQDLPIMGAENKVNVHRRPSKVPALVENVIRSHARLKNHQMAKSLRVRKQWLLFCTATIKENSTFFTNDLTHSLPINPCLIFHLSRIPF